MPDTNSLPTLLPVAEPVSRAAADGFLVVSRCLLKTPAVPPYAWHYSYQHYTELGDADEYYRELAGGEYEGMEPVAILACKRGVPLGAVPMGER